jgi:alpha-galactosidase
MNRKELSSYKIKDMHLSYYIDIENEWTGMTLIPACMKDEVVKNKLYDAEPLIQVKIIGDNYPFNYSQGRTLRNSETARAMRYVDQKIFSEESTTSIVTYLQDSRGLCYKHYVRYFDCSDVIEVSCKIVNNTDKDIRLEMLSSFTLGGLTPFIDGLAKGSMVLHQIKSTWSNEGRLVSLPIEEYQLEPSWKPSGANGIRFGQVGSMPNREYFPFVGVEDIKNGVCWGVQLDIASSWQLEAYRKDNALIISGGLADREKGHWIKTVKKGDSFTTPKAVLSTVKGNIDLLCQRITENIRKDLNLPASEYNMPLLFNEFCTTWGNPDEQLVRNIVDEIEGKGFTYFIIDAGWYKKSIESDAKWNIQLGDWIPNKDLFPNGIDKLVDYIHSKGMKAGIWFEPENCGKESEAFYKEEFLLKRDGYPVTSGARRFLDMKKPEVLEMLDEKVIKFLKDNKFNYIKIDYNANIGIGSDGEDSLGEQLRQSVLASQKFFEHIQKEVPEIVIENCASGGHRLVIPFMERTSMSSFSDAHECNSIPIIAANMHRMILPRQSQIWVVIQKEQPISKYYYQMASAMLGRLCLSGNILGLESEKWDIINEGINMYKQVSHIIDFGISRIYGNHILSYYEPEGWQAVIRKSTQNNEVLVVINSFNNSPSVIEVPLEDNFTISKTYFRDGITAEIRGNRLIVYGIKDFDGVSIHLNS